MRSQWIAFNNYKGALFARFLEYNPLRICMQFLFFSHMHAAKFREWHPHIMHSWNNNDWHSDNHSNGQDKNLCENICALTLEHCHWFNSGKGTDQDRACSERDPVHRPKTCVNLSYQPVISFPVTDDRKLDFFKLFLTVLLLLTALMTCNKVGHWFDTSTPTFLSPPKS